MYVWIHSRLFAILLPEGAILSKKFVVITTVVRLYGPLQLNRTIYVVVKMVVNFELNLI